MIFSSVFGFVTDMAGWLAGLLPGTFCGFSASFPTLAVGMAGAYINVGLIVTMFALMISFELAAAAVRIAIGLYKLLPFT